MSGLLTIPEDYKKTALVNKISLMDTVPHDSSFFVYQKSYTKPSERTKKKAKHLDMSRNL